MGLAEISNTTSPASRPAIRAGPTASLTDSLPDSVVGQGIINQILTQSPFETFGTSRPTDPQEVVQNNLDQSWINCEMCGVNGVLEATPHDLVHGFVGGLMGRFPIRT